MKKTRSKSTVRYAFDEVNRLIISERDAAGRLRPARVVEGAVATDRGNRLIYRVASTTANDGQPAPHLFNLDGAWSLTPRHELALTLHETATQARHTVYLKGAILKAEANALVFALRQQGEGRQSVALSGRWQADQYNRLTFLAERANGSEDRVTLQGGWEVGPRHELLYRYRQTGEGSSGQVHTLTFEGAWDITGADRLVYRLAGSQDAAFEFTATLQSPSLLAREGRIVYQVGIGVSRSRIQRRVTLFGAWKLHRDLSISFEIPYADGRVQAIRFEGAYAIGAKNQIVVALHNSRREGLGLSVTFTRELVRDATLFLRLQKDAQERAVIGGVQVRF